MFVLALCDCFGICTCQVSCQRWGIVPPKTRDSKSGIEHTGIMSGASGSLASRIDQRLHGIPTSAFVSDPYGVFESAHTHVCYWSVLFPSVTFGSLALSKICRLRYKIITPKLSRCCRSVFPQHPPPSFLSSFFQEMDLANRVTLRNVTTVEANNFTSRKLWFPN